MNKTAIEWCDFTWNPVTGCKRGCTYCYARRIHNRFHPETPFSKVAFHPERLADPKPSQKRATIFVGSMSDPEYWSRSWFNRILDVCVECWQHTFMFLTKNVDSYEVVSNWPYNTMQGLTLEHVETKEAMEAVDDLAKLPRPFLSLEPLRGLVWVPIPEQINPVIVGAMTGPGAEFLHPDLVASVRHNAENIFWKSSIPGHMQ